jgi:thiamine-monophosphate kinase
VVGGVHVMADEAPDAIARKALRVNLSDLAAKGAAPAAFMLSIGLPRAADEVWLSSFCEGLRDDSAHYGCPLIGGDTDRVPGPLAVTIFALGTLPRGSMVRRLGARRRDNILVTGTIGDAALGLRLRQEPDLASAWGLSGTERDFLLSRYRLPQPRTEIAAALRACASAAMDVSDGFAGDLSKLLRVSSVGASIAACDVPLSDAARKALAADPALYETLLAGGDDYEIVCTVADDKLEAMRAAAAAAGIAVHVVGRIAAGGAGLLIRDASDAVMDFTRASFSHF